MMSDPAPIASHPDWSRFTLEIHCPRCGYDLRMLTMARCPECGLRFSWDAVVAAAKQRLESPLFEDHWRDRPARSLVRTVGLSLLPWRLWSRTRLEHIARVGPLLAMVPLVLLCYALYWLGFQFAWRWYYVGFGEAIRYSGPVYRWPYENLVQKATFFVAVGCALWLSIQVWRQTLGKHRVRQPQILRVVILSWTALVVSRVIVSLALMAAGMALLARTGQRLPPWAGYLPSAISMGLFVGSVCIALQVYLRLRRGWLIGVVALVVAWAMVATLLMGISFYCYDSLRNPWFRLLDLWCPGTTRWIISAFQLV